MPYIPKSKYDIKYTNGDELYNPSNGQPYSGEYIQYGQKYFAGNSILNLRIPLEKIKIEDNLIAKNARNFLYNQLNPKQYNKLKKSIPPITSKPQPTEEDYEKGIWERYFCQRVNNNNIVLELDIDGYTKLERGEYDNLLYRSGKIKWSLKDSQLNINNILLLERTYPQIRFFFVNPEEFVK